MGQVYSTNFIRSRVPGVWIYFQVPNARRAVVRSISATSYSAPGLGLSVTADGVALYVHPFQAGEGTRLVDVRATLTGGSVLACWLEGTEMHTSIDGFLFDDLSDAPREALDLGDPSSWPPPPPAASVSGGRA
jgi:hypothetical protein